uniref:Uncharacterized protein n=1 Tax=Anopheles farauti TaxID=69004 RepID=A0A182QD89_9DIPT
MDESSSDGGTTTGLKKRPLGTAGPMAPSPKNGRSGEAVVDDQEEASDQRTVRELEEAKRRMKKRVDFMQETVPHMDTVIQNRANQKIASIVTSWCSEGTPVYVGSPVTDEDFEHLIDSRMQDLENIRSDSDSDFGDDHGLPPQRGGIAGAGGRGGGGTRKSASGGGGGGVKGNVGGHPSASSWSDGSSTVSDVEEEVDHEQPARTRPGVDHTQMSVVPSMEAAGAPFRMLIPPMSPGRRSDSSGLFGPSSLPIILPFHVRRRLSECREEDEEDEKQQLPSHSPPSAAHRTPAPIPSIVIGAAEEEEEEEAEEPTLPPVTESTNKASQEDEAETTIPRKSRFMVTKTEEQQERQDVPKSPSPRLRPETIALLPVTASLNSQTIHFPCSSGVSQQYGQRTSLRSIFSPADAATSHHNTPHLDRRFFDTSLVEIRPLTQSRGSLSSATGADTSGYESTVTSLPPPTTSANIPFELDEVWVKRPDPVSSSSSSSSKARENDPSVASGGRAATLPANAKPNYALFADQKRSPTKAVSDAIDGAGSGNFQRPSTAPATASGESATRASKKQKKTEKEAKKQEKEVMKQKREEARRLEKEAAKLEKLNRKHESISRSSERVGSGARSGSLERRRSGEEAPVLNQSTVHGIASPNRRPTIFDVFRPRKGSDSKKKKDDGSKSGSDKDSTGMGSGPISTSGGIMNSMKAALHVGGRHSHQHQHQPSGQGGTASGGTGSKVRDGSAHPHAGSDAQYYHTVTAVRRADVGKSPMTKVMDLFRHRSNSAVSEADKRKAVSHGTAVFDF